VNQITRGEKIPVNVTLSADLVREARTFTADLSETVDGLLSAYVERERSKRANEQLGIDAMIAWTNEFIAKHGLPGEDFSPL
jgi:antitoxin CcdA